MPHHFKDFDDAGSAPSFSEPWPLVEYDTNTDGWLTLKVPPEVLRQVPELSIDLTPFKDDTDPNRFWCDDVALNPPKPKPSLLRRPNISKELRQILKEMLFFSVCMAALCFLVAKGCAPN